MILQPKVLGKRTGCCCSPYPSSCRLPTICAGATSAKWHTFVVITSVNHTATELNIKLYYCASVKAERLSNQAIFHTGARFDFNASLGARTDAFLVSWTLQLDVLLMPKFSLHSESVNSMKTTPSHQERLRVFTHFVLRSDIWQRHLRFFSLFCHGWKWDW